MSTFDPDAAARELLAALGPNDSTSQVTKGAPVLERFQRNAKLIENGMCAALDRSEDQLILEQLSEIACLLRLDAADADIRELLARFLDSVDSAADARKILGLEPAGHRPSKNHLMERAIAAYELAINEGLGDEVAIQRAYNLYRSDTNNLYAKDRQRPVQTELRGVTNEADRFIEKQLRPALRKAGVLARKQAGRKKNPPKK